MTIFALAHIAAGTLAVLTGLIALFAQKGGKLHRRAGRVFVGTMILTAGGGALYAFDRPEALTAIIGFFTCYLVLSSLHTVWPRGRHARVLDYFTLLAALLLAAIFFGFGAKAPPIEPEFGITPAAFLCLRRSCPHGGCWRSGELHQARAERSLADRAAPMVYGVCPAYCRGQFIRWAGHVHIS